MIDESEQTAVTALVKASEPVRDSEACLVMIYGTALGRRFPLALPADKNVPTELIVGRSQTSDIQLDEESVSRKHAAFVVYNSDHVVVRDFESTNGTYVNEKTILQDVPLRDGDLIKIGRSIFKYLSSNNLEAQYHEEIYRLTTTDGLTGIYNKRYFIESLEREMGRCFRYERPLSLLMLDIDFFKKINDQHGHLAGDSVLKQLAVLIQDNVRREDIFARYGGEEFAIILPEVTHDGALILAEKLRGLVAAKTQRFDDEDIAVTISIGVASLPKTELQPEGFVKVADAALYEAKNNGRNKVCSGSNHQA